MDVGQTLLSAGPAGTPAPHDLLRAGCHFQCSVDRFLWSGSTKLMGGQHRSIGEAARADSETLIWRKIRWHRVWPQKRVTGQVRETVDFLGFSVSEAQQAGGPSASCVWSVWRRQRSPCRILVCRLKPAGDRLSPARHSPATGILNGVRDGSCARMHSPGHRQSLLTILHCLTPGTVAADVTISRGDDPHPDSHASGGEGTPVRFCGPDAKSTKLAQNVVKHRILLYSNPNLALFSVEAAR